MSPSPTVALAQQLIQRPSVTPSDAGCQALILARLEAIGFVGEWMNCAEVTNLWATRGALQGKTGPLLAFAGHTDVVPPGPLGAWKFPPFGGEIRDGMLHGRGAADMKGSLASFVTACERFTQNHPAHRGALGLLITSDEEGVAQHGTREVMRVLASRKQHIDMCIVGEPSSDQQIGDTIKVGRRGSLSATLRIKGKQGHIAYPLDNPLHRAVQISAELLAMQWDAGTDNFQPTCLQFSNFHGGTGAGNVIPGEVAIQFNLRYSPQLTAQQIRERIEQALARHHPACEIEWRLSGAPFESAPGKLLAAVSECVQAITGRKPTRSTAGGTSDGRFIAPRGAEVVELGPVNATIHQIDELVATADLERLSLVYERILEKILL